MRGGESLVPMTHDMLKRIFDEATPDFSARICPNASPADLDPRAIQWFRAAWRRKSNLAALDSVGDGQLLADAELVVDGGVTYAALALLGTPQALSRHLPQAEVIFEYRPNENAIAYSTRSETNRFFLYADDLWQAINARNEMQQFRDGMFVRNIPAFNEDVVREAVLNAVSHRDYQVAGSVFVRQSPRRLEVVSPGGFPPGISADNILWRQEPRNRRIAAALAKCGLVERSGQGANLMYRESIVEGKALPDFTDTDEHQVSIAFRGEIHDPALLRFLEQIGKETSASFGVEDLLVLDLVRRDKPIPERLKEKLQALVGQRLIERVGRGRGTHYILSWRFYGFAGKRGVYTRKKGLDRDTNRAILLKHIQDNHAKGSALAELLQTLPHLTRGAVRALLYGLQSEGLIHHTGQTRSSLWYTGPGTDGTESQLAEDSDPG